MRCSFRFYGQLNDLLPYTHRGRPFACTLRTAASVKDVVEGLGVPHPEVDVILVNGEAQDFLYRVRDGDRIAVYPRFEAIDLGSLRRVGLPLPDPIRFAVDEHATKLASLLRLAGFDALTASGNAPLANRAAAEMRVVLTRDVALLKRNEIKWGHWVRNIIPARQLGEVVARFDLAGRARPFSRCLRCNVPVVPVSAEAAAGRLLPRTRAAFREFHECPACRRVYWKGAHYHAMCRLLETVGAPAAATTSP